jgi:hypothetical protein
MSTKNEPPQPAYGLSSLKIYPAKFSGFVVVEGSGPDFTMGMGERGDILFAGPLTACADYMVQHFDASDLAPSPASLLHEATDSPQRFSPEPPLGGRVGPED